MTERGRPQTNGATPPANCDALHRALGDCHRRMRDQRQRSIACRHLNRSLAECLVAVFCPEEVEAVRSLCASSGTALKRSQCRDARLALSVCLAVHQDVD
ncbi:hypothetical protein AXF42_Ash001538 [Apostasia shenzhenica]|uniref:COX assembly mitochondrial protein n=1 Tax=Apostasia shenzhenica TaxID=1088818 RepID=A0A2I0AAI8_9ASPA|nr:hypothetical protein AXF42_Ash001538 [Apostasia shenzhenica]